MPSYFESLSMVALEAWALGRPVLANGECDVLRGQCARSNAGLYYEGFEEFAETLYAIEANPQFEHALGGNGREYFSRHYAWPVIEQKYVDMLAQLADADRDGRADARDGAAPGLVRAAAAGRAACGRGPGRRAVGPGAGRAQGDLTGSRSQPAIGVSEHGWHDRAPSTRSWRRSATATRSATRSSASSACCARPATSRTSSSRPPTRASST